MIPWHHVTSPVNAISIYLLCQSVWNFQVPMTYFTHYLDISTVLK